MLLIKRAQKHDTDAFIQLIDEYKTALYKVAKSYLKNEEDAADAIQDTILDAYEHIRGLKKEGYFKTWLVRILINHCTKTYRSNQHKAPFEDSMEQESHNMGNADVEFRALLSILPDDSRTIFQLYYGELFTTREIAEILNMKESTVKSRLHRGKEQLRVALQCR